MKKLVALLAALVMLLSCTAAFAEETAEAVSTITAMTVSVDESTVQSYVSLLDSDGSLGYAQIASAALDMLGNLGIYFVEEGNLGHVSVELGDTVIANLTGIVEEDGITLVSSLFPHYAIHAKTEDLVSLTLNGQSVSEEELEAAMQEICTVLAPYWEDVQTAASGLTLQTAEDGSLYTEYTAKFAGDVFSAWAARLAEDTVLQGYLQEALNASGETNENGEPLTAADLIAELQAAATELLSNGDAVLSEYNVYTDETTGEQYFTITIMNTVYASLCLYTNESGHPVVDAYLFTDTAGQDTWEAAYNAIINGENTDDLLLGMTIEISDSETFDGLAYLVSAGVEMDLWFGYTEDAGDYESYAYAAFDPGMGTENGVIGLEFATVESAESMVETPSLEGLTVLEVSDANLSEEDAQLLLADLQNYGLATLLTNAQTAMPEQVSTLLSLLTAAQE